MTEFTCPVCGAEWYEADLQWLEDLGCPECGRKFNLAEFMHEDEPLWHDWRSKCYHRMKRQKDIADETEKFMETNEKLGL